MNKFVIENLDLYYGAFQALKNINIVLPERQITAFIGPSGCGKSTLLKTLNRMNDLVEGCWTMRTFMEAWISTCSGSVWEWSFRSQIRFR